MSRARLRRVDSLLSKLRARNRVPDVAVITYNHNDETDCDRQLAALRATGFSGVIACFPDNGRGVTG